MATFGHEKDNLVNDAHENASLDDYLLRFNAVAVFTWLSAGHTFKQIADLDTNGEPTAEHTGIVDHGNGTYTNPPPPVVIEE